MTARRVESFPDTPALRLSPGAVGRRMVLLYSLMGVLPGCSSGFEAASVYPRTAYDDEGAEIYIYGHGFEQGATAAVTWTDANGQEQSAPISNLEVIDAYTMRGALPILSDQLDYPIYPYHEFTDYPEDITAGLYSCATGEPIIWDQETLTGHCDASGVPLAYASPGGENPRLPPGGNDPSIFNYAPWYEYLLYCSYNWDPSGTVLSNDEAERMFSLLVPDYGLGCFYPDDPGNADDGTDLAGRPLTYSYCPVKIPAVEVNLLVTLPDGSLSEIPRALAFLSWGLDYYYNDAYGDRVMGSFGEALDAYVGAGPAAEALTDLNGDGLLDLVTANADGTLSLLAGPTFDAEDPGSTLLTSLLQVGAGPRDAAGGDLDGDGITDLVSADTDGKTLTLWFGEEVVGTDEAGAETVFYQYTDTATLEAPVAPTRVAVADLTGTGNLDLVALCEGTDVILVYLHGDTPGTFSTPTAFVTGAGPASFGLGDLDQDEDIDVVVANAGETSLSLLLNNGSGTFSSGGEINIGSTPGVVATLVQFAEEGDFGAPRLVDLSGDGVVDIVVIDADLNRLLVLKGNETGTDYTLGVVSLDAKPVSVTLGDANGDEALDLITINDDGTVSVVVNDGSGGFSRLRDIDAFLHLRGYDEAQNPVAIVSQDLDGDWDYDIAVVNPGTDEVIVLSNPSTIREYYRYTLNRCRL